MIIATLKIVYQLYKTSKIPNYAAFMGFLAAYLVTIATIF